MTDKGGPTMSVIILTPDSYDTIRKTMNCLRAQTVRDQLEIIVVAPSTSGLNGEPELKDFNRVRLVEVGPMNSTAVARAAGVREATAPVIALAEDHSYPEPQWAEALIAAHRGPWAAVGPAVGNANPQSALSWANLAIEYGPWLDPAPRGPMDHLPGHNSSYKRDLLLAYGSQLEAMLHAESVLHWNLRGQGHQLYLESSARTFHLNFSLALPTIPLRFFGGRLFAASRAQGWSGLRRFLYAAASPLIPLVRLRRILRDLHRAGRLQPRILPLLILALAIDAAGEMIGYLLGSGQAMCKLTDMEFHRHRYQKRREQ
jgi:Glycosyl transferase family 2